MPFQPPKRPQRNILQKRARRGFRGYPVATVAYYGADDTFASKVAVGILPDDKQGVAALERWFAVAGVDVRWDADINRQILDFIEQHQVRSVAVSNGIIGCPHEEGIDYPYDKPCPKCPFWANRDRWTGKLLSEQE